MALANSVSIEAGSTDVVGHETSFVAAEGDLLIVNGITAIIAAANSTASLTLAKPWPGGAVVEDLDWDILNIGPYWRSTVTTNKLVTDLIRKIDGGLPLKPDATGTLAKRADYNGQPEGFLFMQTDADPWLLYVKTGPLATDWSSGQRLQADQAQSTIEAQEAAADAAGAASLASEWSMTTGRVVVGTTEYSAKEYAIGSTVPAGSAKEWATLTGAEVEAGQGYSAKEYSVGTGSGQGGSAKDWATKTGLVVVTGSYSAKEYAQGTTSGTGGSALSWASRTGSVIPGTSEYSAKEYAVGTTVPTGSAKDWSSKTGAVVIAGFYSAKEYAQGATAAMGGSSKDWAQKTGAVVGNTTEYSAKEYAVGTTVPAGSAKDWATKTSAEVVVGQGYGAKKYSQDAKTEADRAASIAAGMQSGIVPDNSITNAKLADMAAGTVKMRRPGTGTGDPVDATLVQLRGDLGLLWTPLQLIDVSADVAAIDVALPSGWRSLRIIGDIVPSSVAVDNRLIGRVSHDNGVSYRSGASDYLNGYTYSTGTTMAFGSATLSYFYMAYGSTSAVLSIPADALFSNGNASRACQMLSKTNSYNAGVGLGQVAGHIQIAGSVTNLRLMLLNGNIAAGSRLVVEYI